MGFPYQVVLPQDLQGLAMVWVRECINFWSHEHGGPSKNDGSSGGDHS